MNYVENHDLRVDESGSAGAHVTVRIQDTDLETARRFVRSILGVAETFSWEGDECTLPETHYEPGGGAIEREIVILRPQVDGPCIHYGPDGCEVPGGDCPHLDNLEILCPVRDACVAMSGVAAGSDGTETEQEPEPEQKPVKSPAPRTGRLYTYTVEPEFPAPAPEEEPVYEATPAQAARGWTPEEEETMCGATTPTEAVELYRAAFPDSPRTDAAIKSRYHLKIRPARDPPTPDFAGDTAPTTQYEEADPSEEPEEPQEPPADKPHSPWIGMRVRLQDPPDLAGRTGAVIEYNLDPREMLVALDNSNDRIWLPPESLLLIGVSGRGEPHGSI